MSESVSGSVGQRVNTAAAPLSNILVYAYIGLFLTFLCWVSIQLLVLLMKDHMRDAEVQWHACGAMHNLAGKQEPTCLPAFLTASLPACLPACLVVCGL